MSKYTVRHIHCQRGRLKAIIYAKVRYMVFKKIPSWAVVILLLLVIVAVALWLRVVLPYNQVFVGNWVKMTGVDAYYYMRMVDNLVKHFPDLTQFDPYYVYPQGLNTGQVPIFFAYLMSSVISLLGMGRPDQHFVDVISVYVPPVLAVLTIIAVYFIGRIWENRWTGLLAALLLAIMPGEFLNRSLLGYTDQHIAEVFWSTIFMLFVIAAFKFSDGMDLAVLRERGWKSVVKPTVMCILAGVMLGVYMLTWIGAPLFAMILYVFLVIRVMMDYLQGRSALVTGMMGAIIFIVGLAVYLPGISSFFTLLMLLMALLSIVLLVVLAEIMARRGVKGKYFIISIAGLAFLGILAASVLAPGIFANMIGRFMGVFGWNPATTIMEMQPLLLQRDELTFAVAFGNYTSGVFLGLAGLILLIWRAVRKPTSVNVLIIIWSLVILLACLAMRRSAYYFAVNIALLSGYFGWWLLHLVGFGVKQVQASLSNPQVRTRAMRRKQPVVARQQNRRPVLMGITLFVVLAFMIYPNLGPLPNREMPSIDLATRPLFAPSNAWFESLDWLRINTPEPLGDSDAYYSLYKPPDQPGGYVYPGGAYGVMAWWDYGYWITRIGRRIPFSNPGTAAERGEARYFLAQDEKTADNFTKDMNIRYIIVDNEIASYDGKFHALPTWAGSSYQAYYDMYLEKQNDKYVSTLLFYPEYYRSLVIRLYNFDGKAVVPDVVNVIGYQALTMSDGDKYKAIMEKKKFSTYEEAEVFVNSKPPGSYRIVGEDPFKSPVPLEVLKNYKLIHGSVQKTSSGNSANSLIKIFEYQP